MFDDESEKRNVTDETVDETKESMYIFEGYDYSKDSKVLDELLEVADKENSSKISLSKRNSQKPKLFGINDLEKLKPMRKKLTQEERETRRKQRLEELWNKNDYHSVAEILSDSSSEDEADDESDANIINYTVGDVTRPKNAKEGKGSLIVHCVDINGKWGSGGVFSALDRLSNGIGKQYELADKMKDLHLGDVHIININKVKLIRHSFLLKIEL